MQQLKRIRVVGWKSIKDQTIDFRRINLVIGANGAGKSNLISLFRLLHSLARNEWGRFVARAGGPNSLLHFGPKTTPGIEVSEVFETDRGMEEHGFRLSFAEGDKLVIDGEHFTEPNATSPDNKTYHQAIGGQFIRPLREGETSRDEPARRIFQLLNEICIYHFHDTSETAPMRLSGYIEDNQQLRQDGGNLAAMLFLYQQKHPAIYRRIVGAVGMAVPGFVDFVLQPQRLDPTKILLNWKHRSNDYLLGPHQLSDGSIRFIALATLLNQPAISSSKIIVVDEPELGLHPAAIGLLGGMIKSAAIESQLILATQSADLLDQFSPDDVLAVNCREGVSEFQRFTQHELQKWMEDYSLGELWEKNVLGGGPYG